jgi:NADPH:quinone reductase-like Zn-dependent oxidoreductase
VIQFAKLSGFDYIITTASAKHTEYLKSLGATHIVDRDVPVAEIPAALKDIVGSLEIEVAYDTIGNPETSLAQAMAAVIPGGRVVTTNVRVAFEPQEGKLLSRVNATSTIPHNVEPLRKLALRLPGLLEDKSVQVCFHLAL